MKYLVFALLAFTFSNCNNGQQQAVKTKLSATEFAEKIKDLPTAPLIDVRTPAEFEKGHLQNAQNIDWNGGKFDSQIATFDKSKPILVYCLSGGRSGSAAAKMRADGFKEVYELDGGIMKWRAANLPETTASTISTPSVGGLNKEQFLKQVVSDKTVLVDFYADWCGPCKKMKPYLDEISKNMADKVIVLSINTDDNPELCKELNIEAIPILQVYKNKKLTWTNIGYIEKAEVLKQL